MHRTATGALAVALLTAAPASFAQNGLSLREGKFEGRSAWILENGSIRVSVLAGGGHIAETRLVSSDPKVSINPMRVPHYRTIDPHTYDPARHDALYGDGPGRWLMSGYMGHLLCFPSYGPPSADEVQAGLGPHGEAPISEWTFVRTDRAPDRLTLRYAATLRKTQFRVERAVTIRVNRPVVQVEEWVENLAPFDRPINWMQHATFGPPFVEPGKTTMDVSGTRGQASMGRAGNNSLKPGSEVNWPDGTGHDGKPVSLRAFQPREHAGTYYVMRLDPAREQQFFAMYHPGYRTMIGYAFPAADNPWLADWQENRNNAPIPWNRQVIARGIEFGSSPFDEGLRKSVERGAFLGTPSYRWIGGRARLRTEFWIVLTQIPEGYAGVKNLLVEPDGGHVYTER